MAYRRLGVGVPFRTAVLDACMHACIDALMATKTISIDLDAYERLRRARRERDESFSQVIKRAEWPAPPSTGAALLAALGSAPVLTERSLALLERAQRDDSPPGDSWSDSRSTRRS
jgi:hypothetical protein